MIRAADRQALLASIAGLSLLNIASAEVLGELEVMSRVVWDEATTSLAELELEPSVEWQLSRGLIRLSARARAQSSEQLERRPPNLSSYSAASRPREMLDDQFAELRDAYGSWWFSSWNWSIGKQRVNWGKLDGYRLLDTLNPQDFREFILDDFDDSRVSTWSVLVDRIGAKWQWNMFYSPDHTVHDLPDVGTAFEFTAPRFRFGISSLAELGTLRLPEPDRDTIGARLVRHAENWNWSFVYIDGFEFEPIATTSTGNLVLAYPDKQLLGGNVEWTLGQAVLRAEAAWRIDRTFTVLRNSALASDTADQVTAAISLDYAAPWDLYVNAQLIRDQVLDPPMGLSRPVSDTIATIFLRRTFRNETIRTEFRWYGALGVTDGLLRLSIAYQTADFGELAVGFDTFYGEPTGIFGQFHGRQRAFLEWRHTF